MAAALYKGITRIVSGGQTGVDRAALDAALALGLPCGGWCPKGRRAEDGIIPERYPLAEAPSEDYAERTELNVRDSDATLVLTWGEPRTGTKLTMDVAKTFSKPCFAADLSRGVDLSAVRDWLYGARVGTLNIAGPRSSKDPKVYPVALKTLTALLKAARAR